MRYLWSSSLNKFHLVNRDIYFWVAFGYPIHCSNIPYNPTSKTGKNLILIKIFYILFRWVTEILLTFSSAVFFKLLVFQKLLKRLLVKSGQVFPDEEENTYLDNVIWFCIFTFLPAHQTCLSPTPSSHLARILWVDFNLHNWSLIFILRG